MGWFSWLFRSVEPAWLGECYNFVVGLSESETPEITYGKAFGYLYIAELHFSDVKVMVEYNRIRQEWDMEIWDKRAHTHLFYHDCLDWKPTRAIDHLSARFGIGEKISEMILEDAAAKLERRITADETITKYTKVKK